MTNCVYTSCDFDTPTMRDSMLPGLLGLTSMKQRRAILDMVNNQLHFLGPGDFDLLQALPPGTETYDLVEAPSGHLILPCNCYEGFDEQQKNGSLVMDQAPIHLHSQARVQ